MPGNVHTRAAPFRRQMRPREPKNSLHPGRTQVSFRGAARGAQPSPQRRGRAAPHRDEAVQAACILFSSVADFHELYLAGRSRRGGEAGSSITTRLNLHSWVNGFSQVLLGVASHPWRELV
jgi:hypothetical protein